MKNAISSVLAFVLLLVPATRLVAACTMPPTPKPGERMPTPTPSPTPVQPGK